jgi:PAS domain S-box-containing protein
MRNIAIKHKLISIIMATCLAVLLLAGIMLLIFERKEYRKETIDSISCYAEMIGDNCRAALAFKDADDATETLKSLKAESSIVFACVYSKEGKVLAHYQHPKYRRGFLPPEYEKESYRFHSDYFELYKQIKENDEVIGTVYIKLDLSHMKTLLWLKAGTITLIVLACSLVAYLVSSKLQRVISGPVVGLAEIARVVSEEKNYSVRAVKRNNDEVGLLIDAFNSMLEQIQQNDLDLRESRDKLEIRVRERTAELTCANEQLTKEIAERKQAEKELARKQRNLEAIFDAAPVSMFLIDENTVVKRTNYIATKLVGRHNSEIINSQPGNGLGCIHASKDCNGCGRGPSCKSCIIRNTIGDVLRSGQAIHGIEVQPTISVKGKEHCPWFKVSVEPVTIDNSKYVIVAIDDITERKQAEVALRESENKIRSIVENSSDQIFMFDQDYKFLSINKAGADLFSKSPQEVIGKSLFEVFPEDAATQFSKNIKNVFDTGVNISIEEQIVVQGREFYISSSLNPIKDDEGAVKAVTGIVRDITEHRRAEQSLRKSEKKYRTLIENLPQKVFLKGRDLKYISCNKNYADDMGLDPDEIKGKTDYEFFPRELAEKYGRDDKRIMETGVAETIEEKYVCAGQEMIVQTVKTPVEDEQGNTIGVLGIFWDITGLKCAQEELKQTHLRLVEASHRAGMAEVAADVLHNVGNVLNSINVSTTIITDKIKESEVANLGKVVSILNDHIDNLGNFLTENPQGKNIPLYLTEVSKLLIDEQAEIISRLRVLADNIEHVKEIISTQQSYARVSGVETQISITKLVEDAIQINSAGLERHGTRLTREFDELGDVVLDKQRVLQILVNLISNAKYALSSSDEKDKVLTIRICRRDEDRFQIEVADNGVGILKENLTKIFSHGFTTRKRGHGFGLHSSALAAKDLGGSLMVHSDGLGKGARFTLELPFKPTRITQ